MTDTCKLSAEVNETEEEKQAQKRENRTLVKAATVLQITQKKNKSYNTLNLVSVSMVLTVDL